MRYIKEIELINWMSHEHSIIPLSPGINVITGTSDSGKSAIYRAIEYVYHMGKEGYRSFNPSWVRYGASYAKIILKYSDGHIFERVKGENKNEIRLYKDNVLIYEKLKAGTSYDKEIIDFLGNPPFERNLGCFSFAHQQDPPFLLSQSKDAIPKLIAKLSNSGDYDKAVEILKTEINGYNPLIKNSEKKIKNINDLLKDYDDLDSSIEAYNLLMDDFDDIDVIETELNGMKKIIETAREKKKEADNLILLNQQDNEILSELEHVDDLQNLANLINDLNNLQTSIEIKQQEIIDLNNENLQAEYFISKEFVNSISFMDLCVEQINTLKNYVRDFDNYQENLTDTMNDLENDQTLLDSINSQIDEIKIDNDEYEKANPLCPVCGK